MAGQEIGILRRVCFANSVNKLNLIGSQPVIDALHNHLNEISESNVNRSVEKQNLTWSQLVWQIRADLGDAPSKSIDEFSAVLWDSGTGSNG